MWCLWHIDAKKAKIHGVIILLSPVKMGKIKWIDANISDGKMCSNPFEPLKGHHWKVSCHSNWLQSATQKCVETIFLNEHTHGCDFSHQAVRRLVTHFQLTTCITIAICISMYTSDQLTLAQARPLDALASPWFCSTSVYPCLQVHMYAFTYTSLGNISEYSRTPTFWLLRQKSCVLHVC